jgi:hypothetical protein
MLLNLLKSMFGRSVAATALEAAEDNPLVYWFAKRRGRRLVKLLHYLEVYHRHFARYRGRAPVILEIGVFDGGSLDMWRDYFGAGTRIYGVDVDARCSAFAAPDTTIIIGDQGDRNFLKRLREEIGQVDILIDDGGHHMHQQIATFEELYSMVAEDGIYLCEDMHTSYWTEFGGTYRNPGTFVEYSKTLIDQLNAWHSKGPAEFAVNEFTRSAHSLHYYDSMLVIEKQPMTPPTVVSTRA